MAAVLQCQFCELVAPSNQLLKKHIRQTHSHDPDFNIQCHVGGCQRSFNNYRTYQNHLLHCHGSSTENPAFFDDVFDDVSNDLELGNEDITSSDPHCSEVTSETLKDHLAKWILKTGETRCLTRSAMSGIVGDVSDITELIVSDLQCQLTSFLSSSGCSADVIQGCTTIFQQIYRQPFLNLDSFYLQTFICKCYIISSTSILL